MNEYTEKINQLRANDIITPKSINDQTLEDQDYVYDKFDAVSQPNKAVVSAKR